MKFVSWRCAAILCVILPLAAGCAGGYGYGGGAAYVGDDYGVDYYDPCCGYYGGWGGGYLVGPFHGDHDGHWGGDHDGHWGGHGFPSIPSGGHAGGGFHGGGGHGGGHR